MAIQLEQNKSLYHLNSFMGLYMHAFCPLVLPHLQILYFVFILSQTSLILSRYYKSINICKSLKIYYQDIFH